MSIEPKWGLEWVDSSAKLESICAELQAEEVISVDTETAGWQTGNERLCLIQIGNPTKKSVAIIDPLAVTDLSPLEPILSEKKPQIIAHNAPFEERQFGRFGIKVRGIVDTLVMARKLRPDFPNHTLRTCCKLMLDIEISKEEQTSDWSVRPLSKSQMKYAQLDAEIAYDLYLSLAEIDSKLEIDTDRKVPELMEQLWDTARERIELTQEIAADLAILDAREKMLRETIRSKLILGEPAFDGGIGSCKVTKIKKTTINPERVRSTLPEIADLVISEFVDKKQIKAIMKEHGIENERLEEVTDIDGYVDRMTLTLKDVV